MARREVSSIYWVGSPKNTAGHPAPLIALVHHRMVGTLRSTDAAFASTDGREASTNFGVGYGCGRAGHPTSAHVHQYARRDPAPRPRSGPTVRAKVGPGATISRCVAPSATERRRAAGWAYAVGRGLRAEPTIPSSYAVSMSNSSVAAYWRS